MRCSLSFYRILTLPELLCSLFLLLVFASSAQDDKASSVSIYRSKADAFYGTNPDSSLHYIQLEEQDVKKTFSGENKEEYHNSLGEINYFIGVLYHRKGEFDEAMEAYRVALRHYLQGGDQTGLSLTLSTIGITYMSRGDYVKALKYFKLALRIKERIGDKQGVAYVLNNIGVVFRDLGDYDASADYFKRSYLIYEEIADSSGMAMILNNLGACFSKDEKFSIAREKYLEALTLRKALKDTVNMASTLNNLGVVSFRMKEFGEAEGYYDESLRIVERFRDLKGMGHTYLNLAELYSENRQQNKAIAMAKMSLELGTKVENVEIQRRSSRLLAKLYDEKGESGLAAEFYERSLKLQEDQTSDELRKAALKEAVKFDFEKQMAYERMSQANKEKEKKRDANRQKLITTLVSVMLLLAIIAIIVVLNRLAVVNRKNKIIEAQNHERQLLLKEIHHRVKNNFQIISSLLRLQAGNQDDEHVVEAFNEAVQRIQSLAIVHEMIYKQEDFSNISTTEYFQTLIRNLEALTLDKRVVFTFKDELGALDSELLFPLGIVINELVTNSYKHAFGKDETIQPRIEIRLKKAGDLIYLYYRDNGVGFEINERSKSFGMELIRTIIEQFDGDLEKVKTEDGLSFIRLTIRPDSA